MSQTMTTIAPTPPYQLVPTVLGEMSPQALLAYALRCGLSPLDAQQLRQLDAIAQAQVRSLPKDLTSTDAKVDETMHELRLSIAQEQQRRALAWARIAAQLAGMETDPDQDADVPDQDQEETDEARALKLLRAALTLIMGPGQGPGGGQGARLKRPVPTLPQGGIALPRPQPPQRRPDDDGIQF